MRAGTWSAAAAVLLAAGVARADSFWCNDKIVEPGQRAYELITLCGEPDTRDVRVETSVDPVSGSSLSVNVEEWVYNLGPQQFLRYVTLRDGAIARIRSGGYGFEKAAAAGRSCDEQALRIGKSRAEVQARCGAPTWQDASEEVVALDADHSVVVPLETWTYDFGPQRFLRVLRFRNGRVASVSTGGYGLKERRR